MLTMDATFANVVPLIANAPDGSVAELVASHAAATPDAVALKSETRVLGYKELDERASGLADVFCAPGLQLDWRS